MIYFVSSICFRIFFYYNYNTRINRFEQATIFSCKINFWNFMLLLTWNEFQFFFLALYCKVLVLFFSSEFSTNRFIPSNISVVACKPKILNSLLISFTLNLHTSAINTENWIYFIFRLNLFRSIWQSKQTNKLWLDNLFDQLQQHQRNILKFPEKCVCNVYMRCCYCWCCCIDDERYSFVL